MRLHRASAGSDNPHKSNHKVTPSRRGERSQFGEWAAEGSPTEGRRDKNSVSLFLR